MWEPPKLGVGVGVELGFEAQSAEPEKRILRRENGDV